MKYRVAPFSFTFLAFLLCAAGVVLGQGTDLGTIRGTVTDSTGGVIPGATATVTDALTNTARETSTNSQGNYEMFGLKSGTYRVAITAAGMSKKEIREVVLNGSDTVSADAVLKVSAAQESVVDSWMGWSTGHWDGETLVVDVTSFNDQTWFDRAGNFHSEALHVTERYTAIGPDTLSYEATVEDHKVFTRPWKISMPLYRLLDKNAQLLEFKCVEFAEELMYGHFLRQPGRK